MYFIRLFLFSLLCCIPPVSVMADLVTLLPFGSVPTGANANALAGPLLSSDLDSVDIIGSGAGFAVAAKDGNLATHDFFVDLDYSITPALFDSSYMGTFGRTSTLGNRASAESVFIFTVDSVASFDIGGFIAVTDDPVALTAGNVELEIELLEFDMLPGVPIPKFYSYQTSTTTLNQSFVVGGTSGDTTNVLVGTPFGMLDPSKIYRYRTLVTLVSIDVDGVGPLPSSDGAASLAGAHVLKITAVPEPHSSLMVSLAGTIFVLYRSRRIANG